MARRELMAEVTVGRVRGRPRLGWMDGVKVALGNRGMTLLGGGRKSWYIIIIIIILMIGVVREVNARVMGRVCYNISRGEASASACTISPGA